MVTVILDKPSKSFAGVSYNTNKVDRNKGELMLVANFGPLDALSNHRPQDFINYLQMISAQNKKIVNTQFHAVLSCAGKTYDKHALTKIAVAWLKEMGYGEQPYLVIFHKDTDNNHVHMVTSRVDREGKKISSAFENVRAQRATNKVLGYEMALKYSFSTPAQFYMIIENKGYPGKDYDLKQLQAKIDKHQPDKQRAAELKQIFMAHKDDRDFIRLMKEKFQLDLIFHSSEGKTPYGYSVIDYATQRVFKGSEILTLKLLNAGSEQLFKDDAINIGSPVLKFYKTESVSDTPEAVPEEIHIRPIWIANDIDDEGILGRNRKRKKKSRTNSR
jgi:hypothetical protein